MAALRKVKSEAKVSQRTPYLHVSLLVPEQMVPAIQEVRPDIEASAKVEGELTILPADQETVTTGEFELGEPPAKRNRK